MALEARVLRILADGNAKIAKTIAQACNLEGKKDINPTLYSMVRRKLILATRTTNPPLFSIVCLPPHILRSQPLDHRSRTPEQRRKSRSRSRSAPKPAFLSAPITSSSHVDAIVRRITSSTPRWAAIISQALREVGSATRVVNKFDAASLSRWGQQVNAYVPCISNVSGLTVGMVMLGYNPSLASQDCEPFGPNTWSGDIVQRGWGGKAVLYNYMPTLAFEKDGQDYNFGKVGDELCGCSVMQVVHADLVAILESIVALIGSKRPDRLALVCRGRHPQRWATKAQLPGSVQIHNWSHPAVHAYYMNGDCDHVLQHGQDRHHISFTNMSPRSTAVGTSESIASTVRGSEPLASGLTATAVGTSRSIASGLMPTARGTSESAASEALPTACGASKSAASGLVSASVLVGGPTVCLPLEGQGFSQEEVHCIGDSDEEDAVLAQELASRLSTGSCGMEEANDPWLAFRNGHADGPPPKIGGTPL
jgi:hypothetical protein